MNMHITYSRDLNLMNKVVRFSPYAIIPTATTTLYFPFQVVFGAKSIGEEFAYLLKYMHLVPEQPEMTGSSKGGRSFKFDNIFGTKTKTNKNKKEIKSSTNNNNKKSDKETSQNNENGKNNIKHKNKEENKKHGDEEPTGNKENKKKANNVDSKKDKKK